MMKGSLGALLAFQAMNVAAGTGNLFNVTTSGDALGQAVSYTLCLTVNGENPLSCQTYSTSNATLSIKTTAPHHTYHYAGIKINTPGFRYTGQGFRASTRKKIIHETAAEGYALIGTISDTQAATGTLSPTGGGATALSVSITDLALSVTGLTEYGITPTTSGIPRIITITNTGDAAATGLLVTPSGLPSDTTQLTTCADSLAAGDTCTITITPGVTATSDNVGSPCSTGTTPVPGVVQVTAGNATAVSTNVVVLSYGCIYADGYVYAFDDTTSHTESVGGKVVQTTDNTGAPSGIFWDSSSGCVVSPYKSCYETHANSNSNGTNLPLDGNTYLIYKILTTTNAELATSYAAGLCTGTFSGHDDWYLPAICEMGFDASSYGNGCGSSLSPTLQNMQSNLVDNGNIGGLVYPYWSSTESSSDPTYRAWAQITTDGRQGEGNKGSNSYFVRCSRALTI